MGNRTRRLAIVIILAAILMAASACSLIKPASPNLPEEKGEISEATLPPAPPAEPSIPQPPEQQPSQHKPDSRVLAATGLMDQGKIYLDRGEPDQALDTLERALSIDPANGKIYYYMAEAWIIKKNKRQAAEFNRLAGMYLSEDRHWAAEAADQQRRITSMP